MRRDLLGQITALATAQHGVIGWRQLSSIGISTLQCHRLVEQGILVREGPRVYAVAGAPISLARTQHAGLLCLGPSAVVSHRAAARLHQFDRADRDVVEFTVPRYQRTARGPFQVHSTRRLPPIDRVVVDGFRCTSASRTIIDLARLRVGRYRLEAAIDSAIRDGSSSPVFLHERLTALRRQGQWGVRLLDRLLVDSGGHTMLERRFLELMRRCGLPKPLTQVIHQCDGRPYARVDFYFPDAGIVVEVSGRRGHSSPSERARDAQRRNELQDAGRLVYEYTWEDVTQREVFVMRTMRQRYAAAVTPIPRLGHQ